LNEFFSTVKTNGRLLKALLLDFKQQGKSCYVYGASTKGNTMLQIWDLYNIFDGAAEIHSDKFGRYTVGTGIPIIPEDQAREKADVFFVPNFGFRDLFIEKEKDWLAQGGRMVFAMPEVEVVNG
jgi:NDP-4-keto-2,6-dideoxyhexose 3-C-methyltransferase